MKTIKSLIVALTVTLSLISCTKQQLDIISSPAESITSKFNTLSVTFDVEEQLAVSHYVVLLTVDGKTFEESAKFNSDKKTETSYAVNLDVTKYKNAGYSTIMFKVKSVSLDNHMEESPIVTVKL